MIWILLILILSFIGARWAISLVKPRHTLGVTNGRLAECPDSPNCVSTQAKTPDQFMKPIPFEADAETVIQQLESLLQAMPRSRIVTARDIYLHAEFRSVIFGFVDDVEFSIDDREQVIHFRSASRLGHSDLGVNRKRMEEIRRRFERR